MKIKQLLYLGVLSMLMFTSCSLDETVKSMLPEDQAYSNPDLIYVNLVGNVYANIGGSGGGQGLAGADRGLYDLNVFTADEAILPKRGGDWEDGGLWQELYKQQTKPTNDVVTSVWNYLYKVVGLCNMNIEKLEELHAEDPNKGYLEDYIAEIKAVRALFYYYLLDNYARVPIVTSVDTPVSEISQSSRSAVYAFVIKELQDNLPKLKTANSSKKGEYYGRMTKSVAYFVLAKLALNAEVYAEDNWATTSIPGGSTSFIIDGEDVGAWQAAIYYCDAITDEGYKLNPSYLQNFSVTNETSPENIFVIPMDPLIYTGATNMYCVRTRHYAHGKAFNKQDGWNGASATLDLLTVFRKGSVPDPRLEMCFFTGAVFGPDGSPVMDGVNPLVYKPDAVALILDNSPDQKVAGARWAKYEFDVNALDGGKLVHNDFVLFRYADVLLMKAEALIRAGSAGEAQPLLNQVRARVGATTRPATLENILDERMLELSWEGFRRQDLIRFGQYNRAVMDRPATSPATKVFPIPATVLQANPNLTQNPTAEE